MDDVSVLGRAEVVVLLFESVIISLLADDGGLSRGRFFPPFFFDMAAKPPSSLSDELLSSPKPLRGLPLRTTMLNRKDLKDCVGDFGAIGQKTPRTNARIKTLYAQRRHIPKRRAAADCR